ncbi:MAG TPA: hypothetical protein VK206_20835 [Anaerolineales bacterium]|nr:hypothetical protein [Anaerolineales bacterium]HLO28555.1 hypothetical protein [Anaerolineales bacterium]
MTKAPIDFNRNVFINCPFDNLYTPLFNAIVFSVHDIGFRPRCALEASNAGQSRLNKILDIIAECKYSIHDLSRTELDEKYGLPRFNMPLELGLDLGCKRFGKLHQTEKVSLILDVERFRYQKFISDISGQDIYAHSNKEKTIINIVRDWLRLELDPKITIVPGGNKIFQRYKKFRIALPILCDNLGWDLKELPFVDFSFAVATWISENPI